MKAVHVPMLVLVFVIQLAIGYKVTLGNFSIDVGSANYVSLCGDNEEFQINADSTFSCPCVRNAYRDKMVRRCILTYQWMEFTPDLIGDARFMKTSKNGGDLFVVARAVYENGDKIPREGIINMNTKTIKFSFEPDAAIKDIEALMIDSGKGIWIDPPSDTIRDDAIQGGTINYEPIYICRTIVGQLYHIGWTRPKSTVCNINGSDHPSRSLLVYAKKTMR